MDRLKFQPSDLVILCQNAARIGTVTETLSEEVRVRWGDGAETIEHHEDLSRPNFFGTR